MAELAELLVVCNPPAATDGENDDTPRCRSRSLSPSPSHCRSRSWSSSGQRLVSTSPFRSPRSSYSSIRSFSLSPDVTPRNSVFPHSDASNTNFRNENAVPETFLRDNAAQEPDVALSNVADVELWESLAGRVDNRTSSGFSSPSGSRSSSCSRSTDSGDSKSRGHIRSMSSDVSSGSYSWSVPRQHCHRRSSSASSPLRDLSFDPTFASPAGEVVEQLSVGLQYMSLGSERTTKLSVNSNFSVNSDSVPRTAHNSGLTSAVSSSRGRINSDDASRIRKVRGFFDNDPTSPRRQIPLHAASQTAQTPLDTTVPAQSNDMVSSAAAAAAPPAPDSSSTQKLLRPTPKKRQRNFTSSGAAGPKTNSYLDLEPCLPTKGPAASLSRPPSGRDIGTKDDRLSPRHVRSASARGNASSPGHSQGSTVGWSRLHDSAASESAGRSASSSNSSDAGLGRRSSKRGMSTTPTSGQRNGNKGLGSAKSSRSRGSTLTYCAGHRRHTRASSWTIEPDRTIKVGGKKVAKLSDLGIPSPR